MSSLQAWDVAGDEATGPEHRAAPHDLTTLFRPRGIVVVGASADPLKLGGAMASSLAGYDRRVALVNARGVDGMDTTVAEAAGRDGDPLDLAILCVPAAACADVVRDCAEAGVSTVLICAGGFSEAGGDGVLLEADLMAAIDDSGVRMLGPNTSGFFVPSTGLVASFVPGAGSLPAGTSRC